MKSGVDDTPVMNLPLVVGVAKQLVQNGNDQRLAWPLGCSPRAEAARRQLIEQRANRGVTFGVTAKKPMSPGVLLRRPAPRTG